MAVSKAVSLPTVEEQVRAENAGALDPIMDTFTTSDDTRLVHNAMPTRAPTSRKRGSSPGLESFFRIIIPSHQPPRSGETPSFSKRRQDFWNSNVSTIPTGSSGAPVIDIIGACSPEKLGKIYCA